jgi:hypothetical protein
MARKILNRRELRDEAEAAEQLEAEVEETGEEEEEEGDGEEGAKAKKAAAKKPKRKSRAKVPKVVRLKAFWGVFNQSLKRVGALFEYHEREQAQKRAEELTTTQKSPHFVRPVKEEIPE